MATQTGFRLPFPPPNQHLGRDLGVFLLTKRGPLFLCGLQLTELGGGGGK